MSNYAQRLAKYRKQDNSTYWQGYEQKVFSSTLENVSVVPNKVEYAGTSKSLHFFRYILLWNVCIYKSETLRNVHNSFFQYPNNVNNNGKYTSRVEWMNSDIW